MHQKIIHFIKSFDKNQRLAGLAILAILITGGLVYAKSNPNFRLSLSFGSSGQQIAQKSVDYINDNKLSQTTATLVPGSVSEESGLIKFKIQMGSNSFDSYATKDGKMLFPQAFSINGSSSTTATAGTNANTGSQAAVAEPTPKATPANLAKSDKPMLDAHIVSRCPFGLQMQRAMADAIETAPELANYVTVRYMGTVDSSALGINAMHGAEEAKENLRQICIREEQKNKYWAYVSCQMKSGDTAGCEKSTGIDSAKLNSCMTDKARGVTYAAEDFKLGTKYNVTGSPTLIMGDAQVSEFDFGGRSADAIKGLICAASNTPSAFCSKTLTTGQAATSFSPTYN